jgi:hypothetical protein
MITLSMYRQLDEAILERFQAVGRVRDDESRPKNAGKGLLQLIGRDTETGALVRYNAQPPNWSERKGPSEYAHWLLHTERSGPYELPGPDGRALIWTGNWAQPWGPCPGPSGWHVSKAKPDLPVPHMRGRAWSYSQWLEENRAKRCTVDLGELEQAWHAKAEAELAELLEAQAEYDEFKALRLIVLPD